MISRLVLGLLLALLVASCSGQDKALTAEQRALRAELLPTLQYRVGSVRYSVGEKPNSPGRYEIFTVGNVPGTQKGMFTALRRAYGCESIRLTEVQSPWRVAEARGAFCNTGQRPFQR